MSIRGRPGQLRIKARMPLCSRSGRLRIEECAIDLVDYALRITCVYAVGLADCASRHLCTCAIGLANGALRSAYARTISLAECVSWSTRSTWPTVP